LSALFTVKLQGSMAAFRSTSRLFRLARHARKPSRGTRDERKACGRHARATPLLP